MEVHMENSLWFGFGVYLGILRKMGSRDEFWDCQEGIPRDSYRDAFSSFCSAKPEPGRVWIGFRV